MWGIAVPHPTMEVLYIEYFKMGSMLLCVLFKNIQVSCDTISNIFVPFLRDFYKKFKRFTENALALSNFELKNVCVCFNGSEFCQKLIATITIVLVRHLCAKSDIKDL